MIDLMRLLFQKDEAFVGSFNMFFSYAYNMELFVVYSKERIIETDDITNTRKNICL